MNPLNFDDVKSYIEENIGDFHKKRLESLNKIKLETVLRRKNPYLFRAKNILTSEQLVRSMMDAYLSSQEETVFGEWLERLAIFVGERVYGARKSGITGIDLEFDDGNTRYIVSIKSSPNWGNSSQINKMIKDFNEAKKKIRANNPQINVIAVNGRENQQDKGVYFKYCGQSFWKFISGEPNLYKEIIKPLSNKSKEMNENFSQEYAKKINIFSQELIAKFCECDGAINWEKLVQFNSSEQVRSIRQ
ncbi:MAG: PmeII family type II restriction endonuclease [Chloracidobacterium sp.]